MGIFKIDADGLEWIGGTKDDPEDLCLHGRVRVQIGEKILEDHGTVSATALYLLKSLKQDKVMSKADIQMIPCCGHFLMANDDLSEVEISGCDYGTDWSIIHDGDDVRLVLPSGYEERVDMEDYKREVFRFADKIEEFYGSCSPKKLPDNEFERDGYTAFWNEWHHRRNER